MWNLKYLFGIDNSFYEKIFYFLKYFHFLYSSDVHLVTWSLFKNDVINHWATSEILITGSSTTICNKFCFWWLRKEIPSPLRGQARCQQRFVGETYQLKVGTGLPEAWASNVARPPTSTHLFCGSTTKKGLLVPSRVSGWSSTSISKQNIWILVFNLALVFFWWQRVSKLTSKNCTK